MPMLLDIRDTVADYAELIARVVGVDVEVVDAGLNRLAGTRKDCGSITSIIAPKLNNSMMKS